MEFKVLTLRYSPALRAIDDTPLAALGRDHELHAVREHFFVVHDVPHLLCVVSCQPRPSTNVQTTTATALATVPATPPPEPEPSPSSTSRSNSEPPSSLSDDQHRLYDAIRRWRVAQAEHDGVPRYVVLTNRNVEDLVRQRPSSLAALGRISGFGKARVERYGEALLALLNPERPASAPRLVTEGAAPSAETVDDTTGDTAPVETSAQAIPT